MMWSTMCQFQTWFGNSPYLAYGIQLLPLTSVGERRDTDQWLRQLYPSYVESCDSDANCVNEGWAVLLYSVLATLGHADLAIEKTLRLSNKVFVSAGGSGHSMSNTLWYIATRPKVTVPYDLGNPSTSISSKAAEETQKPVDCGCPEMCTTEVLSTIADGYTCEERVQWLMSNEGIGELGACELVAGNEYMGQCGQCRPELCSEKAVASEVKL